MGDVRDSGLRPFRESGYEILDEGLVTLGEVVIWSIDPLTPRLGDLFLVESQGRTHEVSVHELTTFRGGWSAKCRLLGMSLTGG
ncbi:hypothetical protein DJ021_16285 [Phenylobacterium hankyongense]|uniref:Uncharacterized protein n=1 Tax=Phenylobacterium hankyongense TaxID=1813876 RepID=A0A328B8E1_9CAUL|nr:hypothetical protein [Phenylobacterium hankyongense]RAK61248.1 hypothetical protein DJ021_16285 [Phenylobacterium hankyongense]